jgi:hypothetical protein
VAYFLDNSPTPASFKTAIQDLDSGKAAISAAITTLSIMLSSPTSDLNKLLVASPVVKDGNAKLTNMQTKFNAYKTALNAMPSPAA